jgi:hypothetical protein
LPLLSRYFAAVEGFDLSSGNINVASRVATGLSNVRVQVADLATGVPIRRKFDRILCVNVIMTESEAVRDGSALGVVPLGSRLNGPLLKKRRFHFRSHDKVGKRFWE